MTRSVEDIEKSLVESIDNKDKTIDVTSGPVYDILIQPIPPELSLSEAEASRLGRLHSPFFAEVATIDEVNALRVSTRQSRGGGNRAKGTQMFYATQMPDEGIFIPKGSIVATPDDQFNFITTIEKRISGDSTAFFNTENFRYEIPVPIEAIAAGSDYDIPVGRITKVVTGIDGIDGTENTSKTIGGTASESKSQTVARIQKRYIGFDRGTGNGIVSTYIKDAYPTLIKDVTLVRPKDSMFKRFTSRPAMDIYISGEDSVEFTETYTVTEADSSLSTIKIPLENVPSLSVSEVELHRNTDSGIEVTILKVGTGDLEYRYVQDGGIFAGSTQATDEVWVHVDTTAIAEDDRIFITYNADDLIINVQNELFNGDTTLFDTDALVRKAIEVEIITEAFAKLLTDPSDTRSESIISNLESTFREYIENDIMGRTIVPERMRQDILSLSPNVINILIKTFRKTTFSTKQIGIVELNIHEIPKIYETSTQPFTIKMIK